MKLQDGYSNLEWSKKLKALGVRQDTANFYYFWSDVNQRFELAIAYESIHYYAGDRIASLSTAELGVALPLSIHHEGAEQDIKIWRHSKAWSVYYKSSYCSKSTAGKADATDENEATARAAMLCYLLENKIITVEEVNARLAA